MGYVLKAVLSSAQHPEYGQITVPFPIPDEKYDRMIELLEPLEIGDALRQDCRVDELDSFYTVLNRLVGSLVNFDELDYLAKRLDSFDDGEAAQFQGMACKDGVELTFKTSAESLKGLKSQYSTWYIAPSDRLQFRHLFGAGSDYSAEDIIRIAYGRSTLYEAPSAPAEDIEMQGMSL